YVHPHLVVGDDVEPYCQHLAGVIAATDLTLGYWHSPSNKTIEGITGTETAITAAVNDPTSEANTLNSVGVTTVFSAFGIAPRTWGNRSAAFPGRSDITTFLSC